MTESEFVSPDEILSALENVDSGLPVDALRAASARRAETTPLLIAEIERLAGLAESSDREEMKGFFAFFLLAEWRETAAFPAIMRLMRNPAALYVFGDSVLECSARVLASVFDGDPQPLFDAALDREIDELVRGTFFDALTILAVSGALPRETVSQFAGRAFDFLERQSADFVWCAWAETIARLGLVHLRPRVERAFREGWLDAEIITPAEFAQELEHALAHPDAPWLNAEEDRSLWGDTVEELSDWYGFSEEYRQAQAGRAERIEAQAARGETFAYESLAGDAPPYVNELRNVGRNDPCPCGSGKKYKKCCLA